MTKPIYYRCVSLVCFFVFLRSKYVFQPLAIWTGQRVDSINIVTPNYTSSIFHLFIFPHFYLLPRSARMKLGVLYRNSGHCARSSAHRAVALELQNFEVAASKAAIVYETNLRERAEYKASLGETGASASLLAMTDCEFLAIPACARLCPSLHLISPPSRSHTRAPMSCFLSALRS
jgi:hypothetical protein